MTVETENKCSELMELWNQYVDVMPVRTVDELSNLSRMFYNAEKRLADKVASALSTWTAMWGDAYDMCARILACDAGSAVKVDEDAMVRSSISLRTYSEWVDDMKFSKILSVEGGDFSYNPVGNRVDVPGDRFQWSVDGNVLVVEVFRPFRGEEDYYVYRVPKEFFDALNTNGHAAARKVANAYVMERFMVPYLEAQFPAVAYGRHMNDRKALKADLKVLKAQLAYIEQAEADLSSEANTMILVDDIKTICERKIEKIKERRKELKK